MHTVEEIRFEQLVERYEVLLLDAYGVLVHSSGALPGAARRMDELQRAGKEFFILTNDASKLPEAAAERYRRYGVALPAERIITSGMLLAHHFAAHGLVGKRCAVLGPPGSAHYVERAGGVVVGADQPFEVVVIGDEAGFPFFDTVDAVLTGLYRRLDAGEPVALVLPNPDLVYPKDAGAFGLTSGAVALMLEAALQVRYPQRKDLRFARLGKPQRAMFEEALRRSGSRDMVMIGDQLETDIQGANGFGLDSVLFTGGLTHANLVLDHTRPRPTFRLHAL